MLLRLSENPEERFLGIFFKSYWEKPERVYFEVHGAFLIYGHEKANHV